ncbi:MAG: hypothetical protein AB1715_08155 [Acidobacteriota bacterium]
MKERAYKLISILLFLSFISFPLPASGQGHWEFGFHYSRWSLNILRGVIEGGISDTLETELRDNILTDIQASHPTLVDVGYSQNVSFDSGGDNFGFELRWYPGGQNGSFSLGLSVEKTTMRVSLPDISASLDLQDQVSSQTGSFQAAAGGEFLIRPLSFHLSIRWDIVPSARIHPYITLGFGAATGTALEEAEVTYFYAGELTIPGEPAEHYEDSYRKSLSELKDEMEAEGEDFFLPDFVPFIQLNLGLKAVLSRNVQLLFDAGIWDGFLLRGGVAFRF